MKTLFVASGPANDPWICHYRHHFAPFMLLHSHPGSLDPASDLHDETSPVSGGRQADEK